MTINLEDNSPRVSYSVASGVTQTSFAVPFEFFANADLNVYVDAVLKTLTTDYTVSGGDGSTGTITMSVTGISGGSSVVFTRSVPLERTSDFPTSGPFQIEALNTELDRLTAICADLQDQAARGLQLTDYDISANLVLPDLDGRKGTTLAFNATTGAAEAGPTISDVQSVSDAAADIQTLAHIEDGTDATDAIQTVAGIASNVTTVAGVSANVTTVAGSITNVNNVGTNIADVSSVANNMAEVLLADTNAATATTKASEASASSTAAAASETAAATSETNAAASETSATTSASTATNQATAASTSATNAATSETNAATSETNAATSEANAAASETASAASQVAAANSAASAAAAFDNFDDSYLGSKTSDPTVDNDGDPLTNGDLYFNSTANEMRVYDGANWIAATSAGSASLINYNYTATAGQTTFSGADDNALTLSYTADNLLVTLNGIVIEDGTDYTATSGTSVVLTSGAAASDELNIVAFKSFTVSNTYTKAEADARYIATGTPTGGGLFKGENGEVGSSAGDIFRINQQTLNTSTTIDADENASATGPLAVASGVTLTVTTGGNLSIV